LRARARRSLGKEEKLATLIRSLDRDYQNYSDSVLILNGLADYFKREGAPERFVGLNVPLKRLDLPERNPPRPDLLLQSWDDVTGFCLELKWSLKGDDLALRKEILSATRYSQPRSGWKTQNGTVARVETFLIAPRDDCTRIIDMSRTDDEVGQILQRTLALLSWDFSRTTGPERLYVLKVGGAQSSMDQIFAPPGLELGQSTLTDTLAKVLFYGAEPPLPYSMEKIYLFANAIKAFETLKDVEIMARIRHYHKEGILVTARELYAEQASFFLPWERADQQIPQVRQTWIQKALVGLTRIKLAIPVIPIQPLNGARPVFLKATRPGWETDPSQYFFIPSRSRGFELRYHIVSSYARYKLHVEERRLEGISE